MKEVGLQNYIFYIVQVQNQEEFYNILLKYRAGKILFCYPIKEMKKKIVKRNLFIFQQEFLQN